jgi:hypothetical protein
LAIRLLAWLTFAYNSYAENDPDNASNPDWKPQWFDKTQPQKAKGDKNDDTDENTVKNIGFDGEKSGWVGASNCGFDNGLFCHGSIPSLRRMSDL